MASKYKIHPAANIFPMLSDADFAALKADIEANGQVEEIAFFENQVIDGRNRLRACEELGIEPFGFELTECKDPVAYVLSKNLYRRHLTPSQAGICAARARDYYDQQAKERQKRKSQSVVETLPPQNHEKARDAAGKAFGVSGKQVDKATKILAAGSGETVAAVESGKLSIDAAAKLVAVVPDKREQSKVVKEGKKAVAAKIKGSKGKGKQRSKKDAGEDATRVSSGEPPDDSDLAGVVSDDMPELENKAAADFRDWLARVVKQRWDNDNGDLTLTIVSNELYFLSEEVVKWSV